MDERTPTEKPPGAELLSAAAALYAKARPILKQRAAEAADIARTVMAGLRSSMTPPAGARVPVSEAASSRPAAPILPSENSRALDSFPVTEAALASIVEVRQRIRPELPVEGFVAIIPSIVIGLLVLLLLVGVYYTLTFAGNFAIRRGTVF